MTAWHAENWKGKESPTDRWTGYGSGLICPCKIAEVAYGLGDGEPFNPAPKDAHYGTMFAYMYRRFGIPAFGSDDHKDIAQWIITTPDPAICLTVYPKPSWIRHSFGVLFNESVHPDGSGGMRDPKSKAAAEKLTAACLAAILDLLVPTNVRDVYINALGRVEDDALTFHPSEECPDVEDAREVDTVKPHEWAGYGVDPVYFDIWYKDEPTPEILRVREVLKETGIRI